MSIIIIVIYFRFSHSPGPEQPAQAVVGERVQQLDKQHPARRLHQHDQARQAHPHQEQDHKTGPEQFNR